MDTRYALRLLSLTIGLFASSGRAPGHNHQPNRKTKPSTLCSRSSRVHPIAQTPRRRNPPSLEASKSDKPSRTQSKAVKKDEASQGSKPAAKAKDQASKADGPGSSPAGDVPSRKPAPAKPDGSAAVSGKDQDLDDLLQKLGETKDVPSPDDRPRGAPGGQPDRQDQKPSRPGQTDRGKPGGKDKEIDEHLEELTGRRKKRNGDDGQRTGKVGEIIKEMRDVEEKLGKPDTGEGTRDQQKKIVKNIDTLDRGGQAVWRFDERDGPSPRSKAGPTARTAARADYGRVGSGCSAD